MFVPMNVLKKVTDVPIVMEICMFTVSLLFFPMGV